MKIKIKKIEGIELPKIIKKGDWIDLRSVEDVDFRAPNMRLKQPFDYKVIELNIAACLPPGFEAISAPRSSLYKNYGLIFVNSIGVIDNVYNGNDDTWKCPVISMIETHVSKGDRLCQFRVQLSQKATFWQKLKYFFSKGIKIEYVDKLEGTNRGGLGTTGTK